MMCEIEANHNADGILKSFFNGFLLYKILEVKGVSVREHFLNSLQEHDNGVVVASASM